MPGSWINQTAPSLPTSQNSHSVFVSGINPTEDLRQVDEPDDPIARAEVPRAGFTQASSPLSPLPLLSPPLAHLVALPEINSNNPMKKMEGEDSRCSSVCSSSVERRIQQEQKWQLWHEFMHAYSRFNDWLRLAESMASSPNSAHVLYITAKEELKKFEALQREIRTRLSELESLNLQYCRLVKDTGLGAGPGESGRLRRTMQDASQRWDDLSKRTASICRRLQHFVRQREEFESERENIGIWLAEMDLRLAEVEHSSGWNTADKMKQLQAFQQAVCENAERLNGLLVRGERLIQRSEPQDAVEIEDSLQELLLYCTRVFEGVGSLHTRLLSMRLVFEDVWMSGSDCLSEILWEDEGIYDRSSPSDQQPLAPSVYTGSSRDSLALEWDPSVDVGGSALHDDADSSYFSAITGLHHLEKALLKQPSTKRRFLSSLYARLGTEPAECIRSNSVGWGDSLTAVPDAQVLGVSPEDLSSSSRSFMSAGHFPATEPVTFDPERISAWLGQTEPALEHARNFPKEMCGRADRLRRGAVRDHRLPPQDTGVCSVERDSLQPKLSAFPSQNGCQLGICSVPTWNRRRNYKNQFREMQQSSPRQAEVRITIENESEEDDPVRSKRLLWVLKTSLSYRLVRVALFVHFLLAVLLGVVSQIPVSAKDFSCHHANNFARSLHVMLHYVNGPPPT
ncbi:nesprin-2-like [Polyodon spathula]|uniref:nesprin-2-like n=1 Tax=Polyodon spathula TaxID=7913 RepID=UPI001B7E36C0|nr:nesprin-2-like [Polyodon spathula]XP_041092302.1 nesprin-2-like [Polyodon spathula]